MDETLFGGGALEEADGLSLSIYNARKMSEHDCDDVCSVTRLGEDQYRKCWMR